MAKTEAGVAYYGENGERPRLSYFPKNPGQPFAFGILPFLRRPLHPFNMFLSFSPNFVSCGVILSQVFEKVGSLETIDNSRLLPA